MFFRGEPSAVLATLGPETRKAVALLSADRQTHFHLELKQRMRHADAMVLLAIFLPIQLFFLRKVALGVAFWLTLGGLGVWWITEWFLTPGRVRTYNAEVADEILAEMAASSTD